MLFKIVAGSFGEDAMRSLVELENVFINVAYRDQPGISLLS